jgi:hypothetical protein
LVPPNILPSSPSISPACPCRRDAHGRPRQHHARRGRTAMTVAVCSTLSRLISFMEGGRHSLS